MKEDWASVMTELFVDLCNHQRFLQQVSDILGCKEGGSLRDWLIFFDMIHSFIASVKLSDYMFSII